MRLLEGLCRGRNAGRAAPPNRLVCEPLPRHGATPALSLWRRTAPTEEDA